MAQVFQPHRALFVVASDPHPENTEYRVAWGYEQWGRPVGVTKVQMVYNSRVAGMLSPSFPDDTLDETAVDYAKKMLKDGCGTNSKKEKIVVVLKKYSADTNLDQLYEDTINEIESYHQSMAAVRGAVPPTISVTPEKEEYLENSIRAMVFEVRIS